MADLIEVREGEVWAVRTRTKTYVGTVIRAAGNALQMMVGDQKMSFSHGELFASAPSKLPTPPVPPPWFAPAFHSWRKCWVPVGNPLVPTYNPDVLMFERGEAGLATTDWLKNIRERLLLAVEFGRHAKHPPTVNWVEVVTEAEKYAEDSRAERVRGRARAICANVIRVIRGSPLRPNYVALAWLVDLLLGQDAEMTGSALILNYVAVLHTSLALMNSEDTVRPDQADRQATDFAAAAGNGDKFDPAWRTSTVVQLARGVYDDRAWDRMPYLADALQDAGCTDPDVLAYCQGPGPFFRGCWVTDQILGLRG